jgi:hypothetical protein
MTVPGASPASIGTSSPSIPVPCASRSPAPIQTPVRALSRRDQPLSFSWPNRSHETVHPHHTTTTATAGVGRRSNDSGPPLVPGACLFLCCREAGGGLARTVRRSCSCRGDRELWPRPADSQHACGGTARRARALRPLRVVAITFDEGYADTYEAAGVGKMRRLGRAPFGVVAGATSSAASASRGQVLRVGEPEHRRRGS